VRIAEPQFEPDAMPVEGCQSLACKFADPGVAINALFRIVLVDSLVVLVTILVFLKEGRALWCGEICGRC
jgi:hypothetical protein